MFDRRAFLMSVGAALTALPGRALAADGGVSIPFQLRPPRIVIDVEIGGKGPYGFLLDTGGVTSVIDSAFAQAMKFPHGGSAGLGMASTSGAFDEVIATDLVLGGALKIPRMSFASTSLIGFGKDLVGTFGVECLTQYPGLIDFDAGVWRMFTAGLPALDGYTSQRGAMARDGDAPSAFIFATVMLNDVPVRLALDTGAPGTIRLTPQALKRTGLDRPDVPVLTPAPGRKPKLPAVRAARASLNGIDLGQPAVERGDRASDDYPDGIMGIRLIRLFNFAVDAKTGELWLKRNSLPMLPDAMYPGT